MSNPASTPVLPQADRSGWTECAAKTRDERGADGQFFTPPAIASCLAGWFLPRGLNRRSLHLLDPGAGGGVLTAAVIDRITALRAEGRLPLIEDITIEAWELDEAFLPALRRTVSTCVAALEHAGIRCRTQIEHGNFIEGSARALDTNLFASESPPLVSHAILNPPYRKIATRSRERALLSSVGMEVSNLYAAFVWLAIRRIAAGGELAAITPRSFCNGPYFREFRRDLVTLAEFRRVHLFDSRSEAFSRDEVLQENILFHLVRSRGTRAAISISTGTIDAPVKARVPFERFVLPDDTDKVIHIATGDDSNAVRSFVQGLPCSLSDLGIEVSTGPVVDFRLRSSLSRHLGEEDVPLIYPHCVRAGKVLAPPVRSSDHADARLSKKPVAITVNEETSRWLVPVARFVLLKRFSSKEERRRLVAGVLSPDVFPQGLIGIENHLNFFHRKRIGLPAVFAAGLCRFLNSTAADRYFRQFNGHTQVNASDLRALRYPDAPALDRLGMASLDDTDQVAIDLAMTEVLGAPSFSDQ